MKAVADSSVLISAFLVGASLPGRVLRAGVEGRFGLVVSTVILGEIERSLAQKSGLRKYGYGEADIRGFIRDLAIVAELVGCLPEIPPTCRDPDDDHVLAAAVAVGADYIVTGDRDLLDIVRFESTEILSPRQFLEILGPELPSAG